MKAIWNGVVVAESNDTVMIEGNHYFPPDTIHGEYFEPSRTHTTCPWKGVASYYTLVVKGKQNEDAAWFYSTPKPAAGKIKDYIAFWRGVTVTR